MTVSKEARALILLGLGSPETEDAPLAIGCAISALHAEAEMLGQGENFDKVVLLLAHVARLKALEDFLDDYVTISWRQTAEEHAPIDPERKAPRKQPLRAVQSGGAS